MGKNKKNKDAVEVAKINRHTEWLRMLGKSIDSLFKYAIAAYFIYSLQQMVHDLAGKDTNAFINVEQNLTSILLLAGVTSFGGILYGKHENKLKKDTIAYQSKRIQELERLFDKDRSSSDLTERGETNPEDL